MFQPPFCPYRHCSQHRTPEPRFFRRHGHYTARCRPRPIPRFRCRACGRTFSRQTFRMDYRDHRPDLNARLLRALASGLGLRQSARNLGLSPRCTELKFRKLARHLRRLNLDLRGPLGPGASFQLEVSLAQEGSNTITVVAVDAAGNSRELALTVIRDTTPPQLIVDEPGPSAILGDGAVAEGEFHESMNMAALWKLPVIFVVETGSLGSSISTSRSYRVSMRRLLGNRQITSLA